MGEYGVVSTMSEISLVEVSAMNVLGIKKTGTSALIPELLMKVLTIVQKEKGNHCRPTALPLP